MRFLTLWFPPLVWLAGIYILSSTPNLTTGLPSTLDALAHQAGHVVVYFVLAFLLIRAVDGGRREYRSRHFIVAAILATAVSFGDEFRQAFVPGRHADGVDILIDGVGIDLAVIWLRRRG